MITVIIPAKNEKRNLTELLHSLKKQTYRKKIEILVVDGKSEDGTREVAKNYGCRVIVQKRLGISNARNLGWKHAQGNILIFLEADQIIDKHFLHEVDIAFRTDLNKARANYISMRRNWIQKALAVQIELTSKRQYVASFPTIFRKWVLQKSGGWDERIDFAEDREFPKRLENIGGRTLLLNKAIVHAKPVDSLTKLFKQGRWYGRNIINYFDRTRDFVTLFAVLAYSAFIPLLLLSYISSFFTFLFVLDLIIFLSYALMGFFSTESPYAFLMIPVNIVRGAGELVGLVESFFGRKKGKL